MLKILEVKVMCRNFSESCRCRIFCDRLRIISQYCRNTLNCAKIVVIACLMQFCRVFERLFSWTFSMLLEVPSLRLSKVGYGVLKAVNVDGVKSLD